MNINLLQVTLKSYPTDVFEGFIYSTTKNLHKMVVFDNQGVYLTQFFENTIHELKEIRPASLRELALIHSIQTEDENLLEHSKALKQSEINRNKTMQALLNVYKNEDNLRHSDIENELSDIGLKNLMTLYRNEIIKSIDKDIISISSEKGFLEIPSSYKQQVISYLNTSYIDISYLKQDLLSLVLFNKTQSNNETIDSAKENKKEKANNQENGDKPSFNYLKIQPLLNENGLKNIKKWQEFKLLTVHPNGEIEFSYNIPLVKDILKDEKLFVELMNQPMMDLPPELSNLITMGDINVVKVLKEFGKVFNNFK